MMIDNDTNVIETKFLRCSTCRSYSVKQTEPNTIEKIKGLFFPPMAYYCENCSHRFVEYGSFSLRFKKRPLYHKCFLAVPLVLGAIFILILLIQRNKSLQTIPSIPYSETTVRKTEDAFSVNHSIETEKTKGGIIEEKNVPKKNQKGTGEKEKPESLSSPGILKKPESIKAFSTTTIKVRLSARNTIGPAHRWRFNRKIISIKRETHQHVYVAGDSTGTEKWAVDDQLIINGKCYEGLSAPYDKKSGYIPETAKNLPLDITGLVPPGQEIPLTIDLVDHGKLWANTEIHIVIK